MRTASGQSERSDAVNSPVSPLAPEPLPPIVTTRTPPPPGSAGSTKDRLTYLHNIIQRSIDHAEIPERREGEMVKVPSLSLSQESSPSITGGTDMYLRCMEQLVLAQFESLARVDIMLIQSEACMERREEWWRRMSCLQHPPVSLPSTTLPLFRCRNSTSSPLVSEDLPLEDELSRSAVASASMDVTSVKSPLLSLALQEENERQSLMLQETTQFSAMQPDTNALQRSSLSSWKDDGSVELRDDSMSLLNRSTCIAELLNRCEDKEEDEEKGERPFGDPVLRTQVNHPITPFPSHISPDNPPIVATEYCEATELREDSLPKGLSARIEESPSCGQNDLQDGSGSECHVMESTPLSSHIPRQLICTPRNNYAFLSGYLYRSSVPHISWQLRFHKYEDGILRFSKATSDGKHIRWWTVFTAGELLYVELEDGEGGIGEAKPPLCQSDGCCFSLYFRRERSSSIMRLRLCCKKRSEAIKWVFGLRHAIHEAASLATRLKSGCAALVLDPKDESPCCNLFA